MNQPFLYVGRDADKLSEHLGISKYQIIVYHKREYEYMFVFCDKKKNPKASLFVNLK